MAYDGKLLAKAREELENIRKDNMAEHERRVAMVYDRAPVVKTIDQKMQAQMIDLARITLSRKEDLRERIGALKDENLALQADKAEIIKGLGLPENYLKEIYSCPICHDTGNVDGRVCQCLDRLYNGQVTKELGTLLQKGDECFEKFDLTLYSDQFDPEQNVVPREVMTMVFNSCLKYATNFPNVSVNLLLKGGTGLGKTYLSACIGRMVAQKGYSVCYDSASAALDYFERRKFSRDPEEIDIASGRVKKMLECDLMILDDLGTEMVTPMSVSALYTLINTRIINKKSMIINTNITSFEELEARYTPQISSRIQGEFLSIPFAGKDIRLIKKGA